MGNYQAHGSQHNLSDKYDAAVVANWLVKGIQSNHEVNYCPYCPFGTSDGDCLDNLHMAAHQIIKKLANLK